MGEATKIEWTDATWNPVTGCKAVSPGCANCYAAKLAATRLAEQPRYKGLALLNDHGHPMWTGDVRLHPDRLDEPLHWRKGRRIFVCDMADLFHEHVPDEFLARVFAVMALAPRHTFQVLTKRPERMRRFVGAPNVEEIVDHFAFHLSHEAMAGDLYDAMPDDWPLPNVWLGVSVEDQPRGDERVPWLLATPAAVRFLSVEPLLSAVDLDPWIWGNRCPDPQCGDSTWDHECQLGSQLLHWIIVGGESGPGARPCEVTWIRSLVQQCRAAGVPAFVKQLGAAASDPVNGIAGRSLVVPEEAAPLISLRLRDPKGGDVAEFPADLRVRQFPEVPCAD